MKKVLAEESPSIRDRVLNISNPPVPESGEEGKQKLLASSDFINNYANLLKLIGHLEFVPFSFFEE